MGRVAQAERMTPRAVSGEALLPLISTFATPPNK
jgi:hypothetical protein